MGFLERILRARIAVARLKTFGHPGECFITTVRHFALRGMHNAICAVALARGLTLRRSTQIGVNRERKLFAFS
jgi:hypothetical protein